MITSVVILTGWQRRRTTGGIVEVAGEAVALRKLQVEHSLHLVGPVVFGRIPLAVVQGHGHPLVILTEQGT